MKYLLEIAFKGFNYCGWQYQPNKIAVQQIIEEKLSFIYGRKIAVKGAGRTDAGVNALAMPAVFTLPEVPFIPAENLQTAMNNILPKDIFIRSISEKDNSDFDPRFDALGKAYTYVITNKNPGPFVSDYCWKVPYNFYKNKIIEGCSYLIGEHDFSSFAVEINKTKKNPIRNIYRINVDEFEDFICITFIGKSFLYKMVRSLVGTIVQCSDKNRETKEILSILEMRDRKTAHKTAPPQGLFLMKVFYEQNEMDEFKLQKLPFEYSM